MDSSRLNQASIVIAAVMIVIGTLGNIFSLVVLCRKKLRSMNIGLYLIVLCFNDLIVLHTTLLDIMLGTFNIRRENINKNLNIVIWIIANFSRAFSSWITVMITVHRMFALSRPFSVLRILPKGYKPQIISLIIMAGVLIIISIVYNSFVFMKHEIYINSNNLINLILNSTIYSFLPAIILVICNIIIINTIYHRPISRDTSPQHNTVYLVLAINIMFLICTLPPSIIFSFASKIKFENSHNIYVLISGFNNAFNFVLYMVAGRLFREEMKLLLKRKDKINIFAVNINA
uniref:G-protein coupled receptors family 1 profile domain-containing protein n=1 Tax=Octopus bimaculoides TaxID=37653 RepID=A0A0L8GGA3_OCTBM